MRLRSRTTRAPVRARGWLLGIALLVGAMPASGHVLFERIVLRDWAQRSELVLVVEMAAPLAVWRADDGSDRQEFYAVRVLDTLKGDRPIPRGETLEFFPHAEGGPGWAPGDRLVLFLEPTASRPELQSLAARFPWYSEQDAGQEWILRRGPGAPATNPPVLAPEAELRGLVRDWIALARTPSAEAQARHRALLAVQLASADARLRQDAITDLVRARDLPGFFARESDVAPFAKRARSSRTPASDRIALALLLDGRPGFDAPAVLRSLTRQPLPPADRMTLIRVAGGVPDEGLARWLESLLADSDPAVRAEAAAALRSRDESAAAPGAPSAAPSGPPSAPGAPPGAPPVPSAPTAAVPGGSLP